MIDLNRPRTLTHAVIINDLDAIDQQARTVITVSEQGPDTSGWEEDLNFEKGAPEAFEAQTTGKISDSTTLYEVRTECRFAS